MTKKGWFEILTRENRLCVKINTLYKWSTNKSVLIIWDIFFQFHVLNRVLVN
jgi:hypothetical protein